MQKIEGGVTAPEGFEAASAAAGIKYQGRTDMALVYSTVPCRVAGTFTTNVVKAAPVLWDMDIVRGSGIGQAVIVNSGIANAGTGKEGMEICRRTAVAASEALGIPTDSVLIGSTGVIGMQIPVDRITNGVAMLAGSKAGTKEAGDAAARAIMTTDTVSKQAARTFEIGGKTVTIGAMSKGSGMIHPNMCTMLGYITTDLLIDTALLQEALCAVVEDTFNMISVDGDTSTNDTLLIMANGLAGNPEIREKDENYAKFYEALEDVCRTLAIIMAGDGEGATKLVEMRVVGADTKENARTLARSVISSSLVKAAMYGCDANWGRILCALGYAGTEFSPDKVDLYYSADGKKMLIYTGGLGTDYDEEEAASLLASKHVIITADMHMGQAEATAWGCDLTYDYVKINADYRS